MSPQHNRPASLPLLLLCLIGTGHAQEPFSYPEKVVKPQADTYVLHHETYQAPWGVDTISIKSQFPVSSLRYNDHSYLDGGTPMYQDELVVVVKSDCSEAEWAANTDNGVLMVAPFYDEDDRVNSFTFVMDYNNINNINNSTTVERNSNSTYTVDIDDLSFMEPISTFAANWEYTSFWCQEIPADDQIGDDEVEVGVISKSSSPTTNKLQTPLGVYEEDASMGTKARSPTFLLTVAVALTGILGFMGGTEGNARNGRFSFLVTVAVIAAASVLVASSSSFSMEDEARGLAATTINKVCKVNVEILHDGCRNSEFSVRAPAIRYADVELQNQQSTGEECTTYFKADLAFPTSTVVAVSENDTEPVLLPQVDYDECFRAVEGRPFMDKDGRQIQASTTSYKNARVTGNGWSSCAVQDEKEESAKTTHGDNSKQREALGHKWAQRALGEHASVSSFAAFTMALMANNAPPSLVQDALVAASDEVRHAKVAFETASLFLGQPVEPGPLPASAHSFEHNLTALAIASAREGCIDETLSALLLALEVDEQVDALESFVTEKERSSLKESMTVIAMEEATHSALAWRTIQWVCSVDADACEAVKSTVLAPPRVKAAVEARLQSQIVTSPKKIEQAWSTVYNTLAPFTTEQGHLPAMSSAKKADGEQKSLTYLIPQEIVDSVARSLYKADQ